MSNGHDNRDSTGSDPDMSGRLERMLPPNRLPAGGGGSALGRALGGRAWIFLAVVAAVAVLGVMALPAILSKRINHGEARFKSDNGKPKDDE